jgi:hypothetical protein
MWSHYAKKDFPRFGVHERQLSPDLLVDNTNLVVPLQGAAAVVCSEVHPGFWCAPAIGDVKILRVLPNLVHIQIAVRGESKKILCKDD